MGLGKPGPVASCLPQKQESFGIYTVTHLELDNIAPFWKVIAESVTERMLT